jgi:hypothetical protein
LASSLASDNVGVAFVVVVAVEVVADDAEFGTGFDAAGFSEGI